MTCEEIIHCHPISFTKVFEKKLGSKIKYLSSIRLSEEIILWIVYIQVYEIRWGRYGSITLHIFCKWVHGYFLNIYYFGNIFHSNGASDFTLSCAY